MSKNMSKNMSKEKTYLLLVLSVLVFTGSG
jgi:hypothetical protein